MTNRSTPKPEFRLIDFDDWHTGWNYYSMNKPCFDDVMAFVKEKGSITEEDLKVFESEFKLFQKLKQRSPRSPGIDIYGFLDSYGLDGV